MRLAVISSVEIITATHLTVIDKICHHLWDFPSSVRYYNLITEMTDNKEIHSWAELYFGCRFVIDNPDKLPRIKSIGNLSSSTSSSPRSNSPSPRPSSASPRLLSSPRKLSAGVLNHLQIIAGSCSHVIVLGVPDNLGLLIKSLGEVTTIVLSSP